MSEVVGGVHIVDGGYVNSYVVDGDEGVVLIDTGLPGKDGLVVAKLAAIGRHLDDVVAIVLTHAHNDHTGGAAALKQAAHAPLIAPTLDTPAIEGRETAPPPPLLAGPLSFITRLAPKATPTIVDHPVSESSPEGVPEDFRVIDTPGHSPGHTSYLLDRVGGVLFVGDAAVSDGRGRVSPGLMNRRGGDLVDASIRRLGGHDFACAVFGHSSPILVEAAAAFRSYSA